MGISDALTVAAAAIDSDCDRQSEQRGLPVRNCVPTWWPARHQAAMVGSRQTIILHVKTHFLQDLGRMYQEVLKWQVLQEVRQVSLELWQLFQDLVLELLAYYTARLPSERPFYPPGTPRPPLPNFLSRSWPADPMDFLESFQKVKQISRKYNQKCKYNKESQTKILRGHLKIQRSPKTILRSQIKFLGSNTKELGSHTKFLRQRTKF